MNADTPLSAQVAAALGGLGTTAAGIAQALENKGIRGKRREASSCPLAQYLGQQFPEMTRVTIYQNVLLRCPDGHTVGIRTPDPASDFIRGFDLGDFPNLVQS